MTTRDVGRRQVLTAGAVVATPLGKAGSSNRRSVSRVAGQGLREIRRLRVKEYVNAVAWNAGGSRLAVLSNFGGTVTIWDAHSWSVLKEFHRLGGAYSNNSFAYLPDGTLLTAAAPDPKDVAPRAFSLAQWQADTGELLRKIPDISDPSRSEIPDIGPTDTFVVSADASFVAGINKYVLLFASRDWLVARHFEVPPTSAHPDGASSVSISRDARRVAIGTLFGFVHNFDVATGTRGLSFLAYTSTPRGDFGKNCGAIAFSPDGRFLVTGRGLIDIHESDDGWTRIWRAGDGALVADLIGGGGTVRTAAWNDAGTILAVGDDKMLRCWRTDSLPHEPELIAKASGMVFSVAFSHQGLLAASMANEVVLYE